MTNIPKAKLKVFEFEFSRYIGENNIRFKYIIYYKYFTRLISVKKKKKKNYLIFLAIFIIGYIIFHEQKRVCVCVCNPSQQYRFTLIFDTRCSPT